MTKKYAIYLEIRSESNSNDNRINLRCREAEDRESADFKCPPWMIGDWENLTIERFDSLEKAIEETERILEVAYVNGCWLETAGVVPVGEGEHLFKQYGQTVRIGEPVYSAEAILTVKKIEDYVLEKWLKTLNYTSERNNTNPPPEEWDKRNGEENGN